MTLRSEVEDYLEGATEFSAGDVAQQIKRNVNAVRAVLTELVAEGVIETAGKRRNARLFRHVTPPQKVPLWRRIFVRK